MSPLTHGVSRSTVYVLIMIYVSMFAATAANILYTNHVDAQSGRRAAQQAEQSDRRWCGLLAKYREAYAENPEPPTQLGKDIKAQLLQLYADFRCDTVPKP